MTKTKTDVSYTLCDDGVYEVTKGYKNNGEPLTESRLICTPLKIEARTRDYEGENWGLLLEVQDQDGNWHQRAISTEILASPQAHDLFGLLLNLGLMLSDNEKVTRDAVVSYLFQSKDTDKRAVCASKTGWHNGVFVLPDTAYGSAGELVVFQAYSLNQLHYNISGTLENWQNHIARYAIGNSRFAFAISAGFAAPLLNMVNGESGGFHFRGSSSVGKSAILHAAGSVWGGNHKSPQGYLHQWRATDNSLEGIAAAHNDTLLCLDEISQVDPKSAGNAAYMLANGMGKSRATKKGSWRQPVTWRVLFLSNGEVSLATKLSESSYNSKISAGQEVRIIDITADANQGLGIYETLHEFENGAAFSNHIRNSSMRFYGVASRQYLTLLTQNYDGIQRAASEIITSFTDSNFPTGADGQVRRCLARFGLVAAGGEIAIKLGILPWPKGEAMKAARICFEVWLDNRGTTQAMEIENGINQVRQFIQEHGTSRFQIWEDGSDQKIYNRAGFSKKTCAGIEYYIFPQVFVNEVCRGFDSTMLAKIMAEKGYLKPRNDGKLQYSIRLPGFRVVKSCYFVTPQIFETEGE